MQISVFCLYFFGSGSMAYIIGIDIGGTHADGVLLENERVVARQKVPADQDNLVNSVIILLGRLLEGEMVSLTRVQLSTTLCTNAIVRNVVDPVAMFIQAGPGMNPEFLNCGEHVHFVDGVIDHRGHILRNPDINSVRSAADRFARDGIVSAGIVTKFSHRNHLHEQQIANAVAGRFEYSSLGHRISGLPNFPRRVYTTLLNSALKRPFSHFKTAVETGLAELAITAPCFSLKADGGTMPFVDAAFLPCESVHSGPSASVMGCMALRSGVRDAVLLDIGGTTTDIAILAGGIPVFEPYGVTIAGRPTLIRALNTRSIGIGGDSVVRFDAERDRYIIGPERDGAPAAFGGREPTPTDAMVVAGLLAAGSVSRAREALIKLQPRQDAGKTADEVLTAMVCQIRKAVYEMIDDVFSRPVFTVSALLERQKLQPEEIIAVGGPAAALQNHLSLCFDLPCDVPEFFDVANAVGAARTRPTLQASLYADTSDGILSIPEMSCREEINRSFGLEQAREKLASCLERMAGEMGLAADSGADFFEEQVMNTVRGFQSTGKIIHLKAQIQPGLLTFKE